MDIIVGKGVYIGDPRALDAGDPESIASRLELAGVQTAAIKICDGFKVLAGLEPLIQTLRNHELRVGAWGHSVLDRAPIQEARIVADACQRYEPDFYLIDVQAEVEGNWGGAALFMNELRSVTAGLPLGLSTFWNVRDHPDFPWHPFMKAVDFLCPQVYWRGVDPIGKLIASQQSYSEVPNSPHVPMPAVAGALSAELGARPTPEQVTAFLTAANADPFIQGVLMWSADEAETAPELWQAFSDYQWEQAASPTPDQPIGWAKIKAPRGIWIRSSAHGAKADALAMGELTPIWSLTHTKWGAINKAADRWIFLGNADTVDTTLDSATTEPPTSAPPELFQARVVAGRGLNIRDSIEGRVLRALPHNTVVRVYEERSGWARIHVEDSEWANASYLSKIAEPAYA